MHANIQHTLVSLTLAEVLSELKTAKGQYSAVAARLSLQKTFVDELTLVTLTALNGTDFQQNELLDKLEQHVSDCYRRNT